MTRRDALFALTGLAVVVEVAGFYLAPAAPPPASGLWAAALGLAALRALYLSWAPFPAAVDALGYWWTHPGAELRLSAIYRAALNGRLAQARERHHHRKEDQ